MVTHSTLRVEFYLSHFTRCNKVGEINFEARRETKREGTLEVNGSAVVYFLFRR